MLFRSATTSQTLTLVSVNNPTTTCTQPLSGTATVNLNTLPPPVIVSSCAAGTTGNLGIVTVSSPTGSNYEYSLNSGAYQSSPVFNTLANASYTVVARDNSTGCISAASLPATVNCGCPNPPTVTLSATSGSTCSSTAITINGNSFGGSATAVTVTSNGGGTLSSEIGRAHV